MTQITGGKVSITRRIQVKEYEPKEVTVELNFVVSEGDVHGAIFDLASREAANKVIELLTGKAAPASGEKSKADLEAEAKKKAEAANVKPPTGRRPPGPAKAAAKPAEDPDALPNDTAKPGSEVSGDPTDDLGDVLGETAPAAEKITDQQLTEAITAHNGKIKNPTAIRALIAQYFKPGEAQGKQAKDIPQEERADFLVELKKLGPA